MLWSNATICSVVRSSYWKWVLFKKHTLILEDSLLDLTSSNPVDGIFYCWMKASIGDSMKVSIGDLLHVAKVFEYGAFVGFFSSKGHDTLKEYQQLDQLLPYSVYVEIDVKANRETDEELSEKKKKPGISFSIHLC